MSSGWTGPGARTAPQNQRDNAHYAAIKAQVEKDEREKREAENARRASEGLPPCKCLVCVDVEVGRRLMGHVDSERWLLVQGKKGNPESYDDVVRAVFGNRLEDVRGIDRNHMVV